MNAFYKLWAPFCICSKHSTLDTAYANLTKKEIKELNQHVDDLKEKEDDYYDYEIWNTIKSNDEEFIPNIMTCAGIHLYL